MLSNNSKNNINKKLSLRIKEKDVYLISTFFGFFLGLLLYTFFTPNYYDRKSTVEFDVPRGASFNQIIDSLYSKKIIPSKINIKIAAFITRAETKIKAGRYEIENGLSYFGLLELLLEGSTKDKKLVTIQEGIWQHNMAGLLNNELSIDSTLFMKLSKDFNFIRNLGLNIKNLEGYLLPDTYYFFEDVTTENVMKKLKYEMDILFDESVNKRLNELKMTRHEILTLASIIDGESNIEEEFKKISGVYHNRLKKRIKLQADPTIQYLKRFRRRYNKIYYKDLEIDSPYNTYKYYGLPPGPINNPGREAIIAALYPEQHDYYYFVASGNGGHLFAKTLAEHQRNVRKYRAWRSTQ